MEKGDLSIMHDASFTINLASVLHTEHVVHNDKTTTAEQNPDIYIYRAAVTTYRL